jgi:pimeloyl-ACP methyl ester carboxylesterase
MHGSYTGSLLAFAPETAFRDGLIWQGLFAVLLWLVVLGVWASGELGIGPTTGDPANPVLLFLHGGPGMPEFFMEEMQPTGLARHFTMVWWEQRGAGMSFSTEIPPETMTMSQMIADTIEVTDYLRARFSKDRILLLGHSWGSYLGIQVAATAPDRFLAFVGMAQITHQLRSEVMAHDYLVSAYSDLGDKAMVQKLKAAPVSMADGLSPAWMRLRDRAMHGVGVGNTHESRSVITGIFLPVWGVRAYTITDKINIWRGKLWSRPFFWEDLLRDDLSSRLVEFNLPIYFFVGENDYTANKDLSRAYFDRITAPIKGFYLFENSAHSPLFEEPERATDILLRDVLLGTNALAVATDVEPPVDQ